MSKTTSRAALLLPVFLAVPLISAQNNPRFEAYKVNVYSGKIHRPKWIRHVSAGEWRDNLDKLVIPPEVNFAGKFFVAVHSCGTECRYYTMTDLSNGRELDVLEEFAAAEPPPKTTEGYTYIPDLVTRADSELLIAQYWINWPEEKRCRQRAFVFNGKQLRPITKTRSTCTKWKSAN